MAGIIAVPFHYLVSFTSVGAHTWTPSMHTPPEPDGYEVDYYIVTCYGGGEGGDCADAGAAMGGRSGGRAVVEVSANEAGEFQAVTVGAGGAGGTLVDHEGKPGGRSSFGSLVESVPGSSSVPSLLGDMPSAACPGDGGGSAGIISDSRTDVSSGGSGHFHAIEYLITPGGDGGSSSGAIGGTGFIPSGWFDATAHAPTPGGNGITREWSTTGGGGGGGGQVSGGDGGSPGGGGGGSGLFAGAGGRGQVDVLAVYKPSHLGDL